MSVRLSHDWFDAPLPPGVELGERTWVYSSFAFLHCRGASVRIGSDCGVYLGTFFDLGPEAEVQIGDWSVDRGAGVRHEPPGDDRLACPGGA